MIWTLIVVLLVLYALGLGTATAGSLIHILLVLVVIAFLYQVLVAGRSGGPPLALLLVPMLVLPSTVQAAENLPEYAEYSVCITGPDPRAQTDPEHFAGSALGFVPAKDVVVNAIPHWHFQDAARDLKIPVSALVRTLADAYTNEGKCALFNFYRSDDEGGTHHNAFYPYGAGATPIMLTLLPLDKAAEVATGESKEYAPESMDDEAARNHGVNGNQGQTNSDQLQRRGKE